MQSFKLGANQDPNSTPHSHLHIELTGVYNGDTDMNGKRNGIGTCEWQDGSRYEGDWALNTRHGNGILHTGGETPIKYEGQWFNDIKQGHGKLTYFDG
jgi:hypothetical protein